MNLDLAEPVIELNNVSLRRDRALLTNIEWRVASGEHWVILGRNGAGKTLLLRLVAGYLWPSKGRIQVLGERYGRVDLRQLRREIGWVSAALIEKIPARDTALEVVLSGPYATFGLWEQPPDQLVADAEKLVADMGLESIMGQEFTSLSAGEKQRVLLARSRLAGPRLLILDEPCAGLDLAAREKLLTQVSRLAQDPQGPTLLLVTHRVSEIVPGFTHGLLLHQGRTLGAGPLAEVLTDELFSRAMEIPVKLNHQNGRWLARADV